MRRGGNIAPLVPSVPSALKRGLAHFLSMSWSSIIWCQRIAQPPISKALPSITYAARGGGGATFCIKFHNCGVLCCIPFSWNQLRQNLLNETIKLKQELFFTSLYVLEREIIWKLVHAPKLISSQSLSLNFSLRSSIWRLFLWNQLRV